jgi:DNA polymerase-3 subunit gamma/tau
MSYVVLARKYRPKNFAEMVGQEHVVTALGNALTTGRLHHAYLFTGTRGVGKTTVSRILAKSLNCVGADGQGGITATPCGVCPACTDIDSGRFVDYTELDAASNRGVDEVQALLEQAVYKPVQGRFKVFMIDEVHMLTNTAFNAMLKTLEEPPEYLKFVLATTDPQKVPVTVLSRCLQFNLRPMAPETVFEHLGTVLQSEGVASEAPALRLLARAARGSMRDALSLTDQAIAFGGGQLQEEAVRQMLGAVGRNHVFALIGALAEGDGAAVVATIDGLRKQGLSAASTLEEMTHILQRMAVAQLTRAEPDPADPEAPEVQRLADLLPADQTQLLYSLCLHGRTELGLAPDEYAALVMVLLRLLAFQPAGQRALAEKKSLKPVPEPATEAELGPTPAPVSVAPAQNSGSLGAVLPLPVVQPKAVMRALPVREPGQAPMGPGHAASSADAASVNFKENSAITLDSKEQSATEIDNIPVVPQPALSRLDEPTEGAGLTQVPRSADGDGGFWHALVMDMARAESIGALVRELALQSQLLARDESAQPGHWMLRVENATLNQPNVRDRLQAALAQHGHTVRLAFEVGQVSDSPAKRLAAEAARQQQQAEQSVRADPFVQAMMRDFGGRIVPGTLKPLGA